MLFKYKLSIYFALFTTLLDAISFGLIMPVMPDLLIDLGCKSISDAAFYSGVLSAVFASLHFVFSPLIGNLSDRFGRKPILLVSLIVLFIDYIIKGLSHSMWLLFLGRIISGMTLANYSSSSAIVADLSRPKERAQNFALLYMASGIGFIVGPLLGGLLSSLGPRAPFFAAAILSAANLILGLCAFKETLIEQNKRTFKWSRANPLGAFKSIAAVPGLSRMLLVIFFYEITFVVYPAIWVYFAQEKFGWTASTVGISLGFFGLMTVLTQSALVRIFLSRLGEHKTAVFALLVNVLAFSLYAFASQSWMMFVILPLSALGTMFFPAMAAITSRLVKLDSQGELQGVLSSIRGLSIIVGPLLMTAVFSYFTSDDAPLYFPGSSFLLAMAISVISLALFSRQTKSN